MEDSQKARGAGLGQAVILVGMLLSPAKKKRKTGNREIRTEAQELRCSSFLVAEQDSNLIPILSLFNR